MALQNVDGSIFKAYDIRGVVPEQLNEEVAYLIGRAYSHLAQPGTVAVGRDVRASSLPLQKALMRGLSEGGTRVLDLGLCGTEQVSHATYSQELGGGIMVTASHNPMEYNGMKVIGPKGRTVKSPYSLDDMRKWVRNHAVYTPKAVSYPGKIESADFTKEYVEAVLKQVNLNQLPKARVVFNSGNGCAGPTLDKLLAHLPMIEAVHVNKQPDGKFPNGIPNPLLPTNREQSTQAVQQNKATIGVAFDGDFDRCFLFDEDGTFVSPYQLSAVLAQVVIRNRRGVKILHDPRLEWNIQQVAVQEGGYAIRSRCGYSFFKEEMRKHNAAFGAEASGHFFYHGFGGCDSGMVTWLKVLELIGQTGKTLKQLVQETSQYAVAMDETNRRLDRPAQDVLFYLENLYEQTANETNKVDGFSAAFETSAGNWRFNVRASNTEPLLRLNIEATNERLLKLKHAEVLQAIDTASHQGSSKKAA